MLWIRLALRNTRRHPRRTLLTAGTVLAATALLTVLLAYLSGVIGGIVQDFTAAAGHVRIVSKAFAAREELHPLYENIADADEVLEAVRAVPGVRGAQPRITTGVVITADEEIGDEFTLVTGATDAYYRQHLRGPEHLAAGRWLSDQPREVVVGRRVAERLGAEVGTEILLLGQTQYGSMSPVTADIVGVVGGNASLDEQVFLPLAEVQWLTDMPGGALEVLVYGPGREPRQLEPIVEALRSAAGLRDTAVEAWYQREPWLSMMGMMNGIQGFIQFFIIMLAALAIFNTMSMSVLERTGEIGVMRAMGMSRPRALGLFLVESIFIGLLGSAFGVLLGSAGAWYLQTYGVTLGEDVVAKMGSSFPIKATVYADLSLSTVATAVLLGIVASVLGALLPALRASSIQPVLAMRARR